MLGKQKCKILKEIRQRIADENDIPYVTRECSHKGDCRGTCPRCESELRYLEQQLALRASLGKRVAVAALCAGMSFSAAGCAPFAPKAEPTPVIDDLSGAVAYDEPTPTPGDEVFVTSGEIYYPEDEPETGEIDYTEDCQQPMDVDLPPEDIEPIDQIELMGDVAYFPDQEANA